MVKGLESHNEFGSNFNHVIYNKIVKILYENGYSFDHICDYNNIERRYFSFSKVVKDENGENVEFEVKIRDYEFSKLMLALHKYLDEVLSYEEQTFITFGKFLCKKLDKDKRDVYGVKSHNYYIFKKIITESAFSYVEGAFSFAYSPN